MDASEKLKRARGGGGGVGQSVDRLSALPDDLLHAVLSRLKARQVVRTCVLSTRWRHLWRSVPCLRIDQREFHAAADGNSSLVERSFQNFAHILLHRHDAALLEEFRLHVDCGGSHAESWVRHGISQDETWPCRLKKLHLSNVCLDSYFARHISSRCPALEDMRLKNCSFLLTEDIRFTSSSLKKLVIVGFYVRQSEPLGLILEAPALTLLRLTGGQSQICGSWPQDCMPSLVHASIGLTSYLKEFNYNNNEDNGLIEMQLSTLNELSNVTSLHLSCFGVMFLVLCGDAGLHFLLTRFLLTEDIRFSWAYFSFLLTEDIRFTSSSLKKLVIIGFRSVRGDPSFRLILEGPVLASLSLERDSYYTDSDNMILTTVSMPSLVDASISLTRHLKKFNYNNNEDNGLIEMQFSMLNEVSNVTSLHLSRFGVMFHALGGDSGLYFPECDISDDFLTLKHFLRNSPNLEKLTLRCCKLLDPRPKRSRKEVMEMAHSYSQDMATVECKNFRLTEIIYRKYNDNNVHLLVKFLLGMSKNMPKNKIEISKVD